MDGTAENQPQPSGDGAPDTQAAAPAVDARVLRLKIVDSLKTIYDPEIPVDIYELGLIYEIAVGDGGTVKVVMTLTSPNCPVAYTLPGEVKAAVDRVEGVASSSVELTWDPPWDQSQMSEAARLTLGLF